MPQPPANPRVISNCKIDDQTVRLYNYLGAATTTLVQINFILLEHLMSRVRTDAVLPNVSNGI